MTRDQMEAIVREYGAAKSVQDVDRALAVCDEGFVIDTIPFGTRSRDRAETAVHLGVFFAVFPDYAAAIDELVVDATTVACVGTATMSMQGPLLDLAPTGRTARVGFVSVFGFRDGRLAIERFFFDLASLSTQLGISTDRMHATLAAFREASGTEARS